MTSTESTIQTFFHFKPKQENNGRTGFPVTSFVGTGGALRLTGSSIELENCTCHSRFLLFSIK